MVDDGCVRAVGSMQRHGDAEKSKAATADSEVIQTVADVEDLVGEDAKLGMAAARVSQTKTTFDTSHTTKSDVKPAEIIPVAPFYLT